MINREKYVLEWEDSKSQKCQLSSKCCLNLVQLKDESVLDFILKLYQQKWSKTLWEKNCEAGLELPNNKMFSKRTIIIKTVEESRTPINKFILLYVIIPSLINLIFQIKGKIRNYSISSVETTDKQWQWPYPFFTLSEKQITVILNVHLNVQKLCHKRNKRD